MDRLAALAIPATHVRRIDDAFTAQAFITTDLDDNQITAFHPGAMNGIPRKPRIGCPGVKLGIVAPDGRDGMISHAQQFADAGIPFVFDPGQGLPMFGGEDLLRFLDLARWCTVNDYEARLLCERTGLTEAQIATKVEALIVTRGAEGSRVYTGGTGGRCGLRAGRFAGRPDRLRRCLSRRPAVRIVARCGHRVVRPAGVGDGVDQDRQSRRSEPRAVAHRNRAPLSCSVRQAPSISERKHVLTIARLTYRRVTR
jgi:sugar/nucleoside kinase (ribokinase family)